MEEHDNLAGGHKPGPQFTSWRYTVWAYERGDGAPPILVVGFEWHIGEMHGIRSLGVWLSEEEDNTAEWEQYPEYDLLYLGVEPATLALLIEQGKLQRVGELPKIGRYAQPLDLLK
jgi:hypothetical protein